MTRPAKWHEVPGFVELWIMELASPTGLDVVQIDRASSSMSRALALFRIIFHCHTRIVARKSKVKSELRKVVVMEYEIICEAELDDEDIIKWTDEALTIYADFLAGRSRIISSNLAKLIGVQEQDDDEGVGA